MPTTPLAVQIQDDLHVTLDGMQLAAVRAKQYDGAISLVEWICWRGVLKLRIDCRLLW